MRVVINTPNYPNPYSEAGFVFVQQQAKALRELHSVTVIAVIPISMKLCLKRKLFKFGFVKSGMPQEKIFLFPAIPYLNRFNKFVRNVILHRLNQSFIEKNSVDIIHVHNSDVCVSAYKVKKKYSIPYVITEHSTAFSRGLVCEKDVRKYKMFYSFSNANFAVSEQFSVLLNSIFDVNFKYIPNVVDTNKFVIEKEVSSGGDNNVFKFINVGFLDKKKNQLQLIKEFKAALRVMPNLQLTIVGDGPEYNALAKYVLHHKLGNKVLIYGYASHSELESLYKSHDCFILSSLIETFGVVIIEAMSAGLPSISTRCGGPESIITNSNLGILVNNNSEGELTQAMLQVTCMQFDKNYLRSHCLKTYSYEAFSKKMTFEYSKIVKV